MARRTICIPDSLDARVRELAKEGESFSATVARLIEVGAMATSGPKRPGYVATGEGPKDLGRNAERYLRRLARTSP